MGFILEMHNLFNIWKSVYVIHYFNKVHMKNHVTISTYAEKAFGKFQHLFLIKPPWRSVFFWLFLRCASLEPLCFLLHVPCLKSTSFGNFFTYFIIFSLKMEFSFSFLTLNAILTLEGSKICTKYETGPKPNNYQ